MRLRTYVLFVTAVAASGGVSALRPASTRDAGAGSPSVLQVTQVNPRAAQEALDVLNASGATDFNVFDAAGATDSDACFLAYVRRQQIGDIAGVNRLDPDNNNIPCDDPITGGELNPNDFLPFGYEEIGRQSNSFATGVILIVTGEFASPGPVTFTADFGTLYGGKPLQALGASYVCDTEDPDCGGLGPGRDGVVAAHFSGVFGSENDATVTVSYGTSQALAVRDVADDTDLDGLPNGYEQILACLQPAVDDSLLDPDADGLASVTEYLPSNTSPCINDTDTDGCADGEELGLVALAGGRRDPNNHYDFYDVNGTQKVDAADIGLVRANFNGGGPTPLEDVMFDRSPGVAVWAPGPPDNVINAVDIGLVRSSFNHSCIAVP